MGTSNSNTRNHQLNRKQKDSLRNEMKINNTNTSIANNTDLNARKKKSVDRVKQLGLRSVKVNIDDSTYDKLNHLCEEFDISTSSRNELDIIPATDLGLLIKMFVSSERVYSRLEYLDAYCRSIRRIIKNLESDDENISNDDLAVKLNVMKVKRHKLLSLPSVDKRRNTKWAAEHISIFRKAVGLKSLRKRFPKLNEITNIEE